MADNEAAAGFSTWQVVGIVAGALLVLGLLAAMAAALGSEDSPSTGAEDPPATDSDSEAAGGDEGFSPDYCAQVWDDLESSGQAGEFSGESEFVDLCTDPDTMSFMCDYEPTLPECVVDP